MTGWVRAIMVSTLLLGSITGCGQLPADFGDDLVGYQAEKARIVKLADGGRLAVGSRTGQDITVQWGDPDGGTWTEPEVVYREAEMWTHDINTEKAQNTVAITPDFWTQRVLEDDYAPNHTALVVCHDYRCEKPHASGGLSGATLDEQGDFVSFGLGRRRMLLWHRDDGFREADIEGLPKEIEVQMLPDGSFLATGGRRDGAECHYDLFASSRHELVFSVAAKSPGYPGPKPCGSGGLGVTDAAHVAVYIDSIEDRLKFVRAGDHWSAQVPRVQRMTFPDTRGESTIAPDQGTVDATTVVIGSPDTKQVYAQKRPQGETDWTRQQLVAEALPGTSCRFANSGDVTGAFVVMISCYDDNRAWNPANGRRPEVGLVLATSDGTSWRVATLRQPEWEPMHEGDVLRASGAERTLLFAQGYADFKPINLPMNPGWDGLTLTNDGTHILRLIGNGDSAKVCRPAWTYAPVTATKWPQPQVLQGLPNDLVAHGTCSADVFYEDDVHLMAQVSRKDYSWDGGLVHSGGSWSARPQN